MERAGVDQAIRSYVVAAIAWAGSADKLREMIAPELGHLYSRENVSGWSRRQRPPARALFAIQRVSGLSLDAAAGAARHESVDDRICRLEELVEALLVERTEVRSRLGLPDHPLQDSQEADQSDA